MEKILPLIAQVVGIAATVMIIFSFQCKNAKRIMLFQFAGNVLFALHFLLLGAYTGAALNFVGIFRSALYTQRGKKWADRMIWPFVFSGVAIGLSVMTWDGVWSLLPMLATAITSFAHRMKDAKLVRWCSFPASPLWLVYNIVNMSIGGIVTECFAMTSILIATFRYEILPKMREKKQI